jgi:3-isopropylmalate/(R)-2-methylmalate dehydratase small subunit
LDDIALTLRHADDVTEFEQRRQGWLPTTDPLPAS